MAYGFCRIFLIVVVLLYLTAMALFLSGTFGWFGQEADPLAGIFLLPLGLPWNMLANGLPDPLLPWVGILAPVVNIGLLIGLCRILRAMRE
ncbi:hypothetical protein N8I71_04145 [Roseibacterium sp. SDUM158016]|jgi:hypothetical protein|uniref:hypothetical protein n=1 Tax=Roseicyclus sediminis TaxID=2980997 RepID=UPI0021D31EC4|nr:hypothetical protein [Roseibacterium sp. SDUM158016]MCU4652005.1 hypothetical protein [Roseibacterium sp. SDUM158016]